MGHCAIPGLAVWSANVSAIPISSGENHRPFQVTRLGDYRHQLNLPTPIKGSPCPSPDGRDGLGLLEVETLQRQSSPFPKTLRKQGLAWPTHGRSAPEAGPRGQPDPHDCSLTLPLCRHPHPLTPASLE